MTIWQERFAFFPMDESHLLAAVRYVEMNPFIFRLCHLSKPASLSPGCPSRVARILFLFQEVVRQDVSLFENGTESTLRHITRVIGDCGISVRLLIIPDFVTTGSLPVKNKAKRFEYLGNVTVTETR